MHIVQMEQHYLRVPSVGALEAAVQEVGASSYARSDIKLRMMTDTARVVTGQVSLLPTSTPNLC